MSPKLFHLQPIGYVRRTEAGVVKQFDVMDKVTAITRGPVEEGVAA